MDAILFLKGVLIGFSIAAPVGPIGVLCIMRTLNGGRLSGLVTGLGAATADGVYGCVAGVRRHIGDRISRGSNRLCYVWWEASS